MEFRFEQRWTATADEVIEVYLDPAFWSGLEGLRATGAPEVLDVQRGPERAVVRLRYSLAVELPREAARFIDPGNVTWVEETTWHLGDRTADVRFSPAQAAGLIRAAAVSSLVQRSADAVRETRGELKVRIPLVGRKVERAIVEGIGEHLDAEADAVAAHLR